MNGSVCFVRILSNDTNEKAPEGHQAHKRGINISTAQSAYYQNKCWVIARYPLWLTLWSKVHLSRECLVTNAHHLFHTVHNLAAVSEFVVVPNVQYATHVLCDSRLTIYNAGMARAH